MSAEQINQVDSMKIFMLSGMSESGKSSAGRYFESNGVPRLKIRDILFRMYQKTDRSVGFESWSWTIENQGSPFYASFAQEAIALMSEIKCNYISLESLHGIKMAGGLKDVLDDRLKIIFIDIPFEVRVRRQMGRAGLTDESYARALLLERDQQKLLQGTPEIKKIADYIVDNSGQIEDLYELLNRILINEKQRL